MSGSGTKKGQLFIFRARRSHSTLFQALPRAASTQHVIRNTLWGSVVENGDSNFRVSGGTSRVVGGGGGDRGPSLLLSDLLSRSKNRKTSLFPSPLCASDSPSTKEHKATKAKA